MARRRARGRGPTQQRRHRDDLCDLAVRLHLLALRAHQIGSLEALRELRLGAQVRDCARGVVLRRRQQVERVHAAAVRVTAVGRVPLAERNRDRVLANPVVEIRGQLHGAGLGLDLERIAHADAELGRGRGMYFDP